MEISILTSSPSRPNVLFLLSDEHSYRCLSAMDAATDGEPVRTPTLDKLAQRGAWFKQAYCQVPLCTPSRICLLTGRNPMTSGGWDNCSYLKPEQTLPSAFADAGYETCLIGKMHLGGDRQFVGFRHRPYGDITGGTGHQWEPLHRRGGQGVRARTLDAGVTEIPESLLQERVVAEETVAFLREHRHTAPDQPWMLCASFSRPHFPLTAPRRHFDRYWPDNVTQPKVDRTGDTADHPMTRGMAKGFRTEEVEHDEMMKARAGYFACVDWLDEILGDLLATLERDGLLENTIIVYASDHGELAGEHGMWFKGSWHEASVRVPLFVQTPEHRRGDRPASQIETPVSLADLMPTLCGLSGVPCPDGVEGVDLSDAVCTGTEPNRRSRGNRGPVMCVNPTPRWGKGTEHVVVREGRYKHVRFRAAGPDLLFDLESDPLEQHNRIDDPAHAEAAARLRSLAGQLWDFDAAERQQEADKQFLLDPPLAASASGNLYTLPDGRLVVLDEAVLHYPRLALEDPAAAIADWPEHLPQPTPAPATR